MPNSGSRFRLPERRWMVLAVELLVLIGIAYILARLVFFIAFGASGTSLLIETPAADRRAEAARTFTGDLGTIDFSGLFADRSTEVVAESRPEFVPETQLDLVLRGIRQGETAESGAALIQVANAQQLFVAVGEEISDGVELREVHQDHVIISRRGIIEALRIRETSLRRPAEPAAGADTADPQGAASAAAPPARSDYTPAEISHARPRAGERFNIAGQFDVEPRYIDDTIVGYAFVRGNGVLLESVGLRMNDIVVSIAGRPVRDLRQIEEFFEGFGSDDTVDIVIVRSGMNLNIRVDLP